MLSWCYGDMKTTVDLPDDVVREVKIRAAQEGRKMKHVLEDALRAGLGLTGGSESPLPGVRVEADPQTGLPVIVAVADARESTMSREDFKRLEQDAQYREDLCRAGLAP